MVGVADSPTSGAWRCGLGDLGEPGVSPGANFSSLGVGPDVMPLGQFHSNEFCNGMNV
jgi:hypothetical protein